MSKFSAYLSIYNDWDLLLPTLHSIAPYIDELVVVDGAYEWMAPYVHAIGNDPLRSDRRVYEAIEASGVPFRVISKLWPNEIEKRRAGYIACQNRFIYRVDADEIYFVNEDVLEDFFKKQYAVAEVEIPLYTSPGWIISTKEQSYIERVGVLFDSKNISADQHLFYLWLILAEDQRPSSQSERPPVFGDPIAFTAHLANWRTPVTSLNRAAFYVLNYIRGNGVAWFEELRSKPLPDLRPLFERVQPNIFRDILKGHPIVMGYQELGARILKPSPLPPPDERKFSYLFDNFLSGQARSNSDLAAKGRHVLGKTHIDLSSEAAVAALTPTSAMSFRLTSNVVASKLTMRYLIPRDPWEIVSEIKPEISGNLIKFDVPADGNAAPNWLRRLLTMEIWCEDPSPLQRLECASAS